MTRNNDGVMRDIQAARADLRGRRDQAAAEYDERLALLDQLEAGWQNGGMDARTVEQRVRQVIGDRAALAKGARAGRTRIGMSAPATPPSAALVAGQGMAALSMSPALVGAALARAQAQLDGRIVRVLSEAKSAPEKQHAAAELALLLTMRRRVCGHARELPSDVVLLAASMELAESVDGTLADLEQGGVARAQRLLELNRQLIAELRALGGQVQELKARVQQTQAMLVDSDPDLTKVMAEAIAAFTRLHAELEQRWPLERPTLLDDVIRVIR